MSSETLVESFNHNNLIVSIHLDTDSQINPIKDFDNIGTIITAHRNYNLGHISKTYRSEIYEHLFHELIESLTPSECYELKTILGNEIPGLVDEYGYYDSDNLDLWDIMENSSKTLFEDHHETILEIIERRYVVLPIYMYEHSGITINTTGFSCGWDTSNIGYIYAKKGTANHSDTELRNILKQEIEIYDSYLRGECYGYKIIDPNNNFNILDSCWGYLGDINYCRDEAMDSANSITLPKTPYCHNCYSTDIVETASDPFAATASSITRHCNNCNTNWTDYYKLVSHETIFPEDSE